jgi:hypothetical protein
MYSSCGGVIFQVVYNCLQLRAVNRRHGVFTNIYNLKGISLVGFAFTIVYICELSIAFATHLQIFTILLLACFLAHLQIFTISVNLRKTSTCVTECLFGR